MSDVYLFQLASQRTQWLSSRQALIASNVANANTPGYAARDMQPFSAALDAVHVAMTTTNPGHVAPAIDEFDPGRPAEDAGADATLSGNSVNLQDQMVKLGDVNRLYQETTGIKRVFHQMMLSALK